MSRSTLITAVVVGAILALVTQVTQSAIPGSSSWPMLDLLLGSLFLLLLAFVAVGGVLLAGGAAVARRERLVLGLGIGIAMMAAGILTGLLIYFAPGQFPANAPLTQAIDRLSTLIGMAGAFLVALAVWGRLSRPTHHDVVSESDRHGVE